MTTEADSTSEAAITSIMTRLAAGDGSAIGDLLASHRPAMASAARRHARRFGFEPSAELAHELVVEIALLLMEKAGAWCPGGARPWRWADNAIGALVASYLGQHERDLFDEKGELVVEPAPPAPAERRDAIDVLHDLAERDGTIALLCSALGAAASARDAAVFLEAAQEAATGNRSPAVTVAADLGLETANVRQVRRRVKQALTIVVAADDRYAPLAHLPILEAA